MSYVNRSYKEKGKQDYMVLEVRNLPKTYGSKKAISDIAFSAEEGEISFN